MKKRILTIAGAVIVPGIILSLLWLLPPVLAVQTDTFTVCRPMMGSCDYETISKAVLGVPEGSIIEVKEGTYTETIIITRSLTIRGENTDPKLTIIDGGDADTVIDISETITPIQVTLENLTIQNGYSANAGGIYNEDMLTVTNSIIQENNIHAIPICGDGGGINNFGKMVLQDVIVHNNKAAFGAGISNSDSGISDKGILYANNITVTQNEASNCPGDAGLGGGIDNSGDIFLSNSLIRENIALIDGGGVENTGYMTITNTLIEYNQALQGSLSLDIVRAKGGGIDNFGGTVKIISSTVQFNMADWGGGMNNEGELWLTNSLVHNNWVENANPPDLPVQGGGIRNETGGKLTVTNSTIYRNPASAGGGVYNGGVGATAVIRSSTIYNNSASSSEIHNITGTITLSNTIIANDGILASGPDCSGSDIFSDGSNLDSDGSCGLGTNELSDVDPKLGPLQDNGGPTWTLAPQIGSPVIDAATVCLAIDQRGVPRPVGNGCDIGAYETAVYRVYLPAVVK